MQSTKNIMQEYADSLKADNIPICKEFQKILKKVIQP
jgi:hypothetical protein